jgi:hypothetical protein
VTMQMGVPRHRSHVHALTPSLLSSVCIPLYCLSSCSLLLSLPLSVGFSFLYLHSLYAQLLGFFITCIGRTMMITVMFAMVADEYRPEHYGRIVAFINIICASIGLAQLGLQKVLSGPADNNFDYFTTGFIVTLAPMFGFSYWCHKTRT